MILAVSPGSAAVLAAWRRCVWQSATVAVSHDRPVPDGLLERAVRVGQVVQRADPGASAATALRPVHDADPHLVRALFDAGTELTYAPARLIPRDGQRDHSRIVGPLVSHRSRSWSLHDLVLVPDPKLEPGHGACEDQYRGRPGHGPPPGWVAAAAGQTARVVDTRILGSAPGIRLIIAAMRSAVIVGAVGLL